MSLHKNHENVLDWEITVPDRPTSGLYTHPSLKISILHHTDKSLGFRVHSLCTEYFVTMFSLEGMYFKIVGIIRLRLA